MAKTLKDISQDERIRDMLDLADKAKRDQLTQEHEAKIEGEKKGQSKKAQEIAINMLKSKLDESFISQFTGLTKKEIQKLAKNL